MHIKKSYIEMLGFFVAISMLGPFSGCGKAPQVTTQAAPQTIMPTLTCTVISTPSGSTITCPDGTTTTVSNGTNGLNGLDGTQITVVQFCSPSFVPSYPNTFTEVGLCINNQLFGVYSQNGGFLAKLPPGSYSSNGIGVSCTFTIGNNCSVSN